MPQGTGSGNKDGGSQIIDFSEIRAQKLEEKRRKTERVFFKHLLSVYTVVGDATMCGIELIDVSENGISFQLPFHPDKASPINTKEFPIRLYFSQDTYLEIIVKVQNSRPSIENGQRYVRYGCAVDHSTASFPAFQQFVRFLGLYSEHAHKDTGDLTVFYL